MIQPASLRLRTSMYSERMIDGMTVSTMVWSSAATKTAAHSATMARVAPRDSDLFAGFQSAVRGVTAIWEP